MADEIKRVIEVDASASTKTVRDLMNEVEALKNKLRELDEGTAEYAATAAKAAKAEKELNSVFEITRVTEKDRLATVEELAAAEKRDAEAIDKLVDALGQMSASGQDVSGSLHGLTQATGEGVRTTQQLDSAVIDLQRSGGELIDQMISEQAELKEIAKQRKDLEKAIKDGVIADSAAREIKGELIAQENVYKTRLSETRSMLNSMSKSVVAADGSYKQMSQTLGRMRDQFRSLSSEQRESAMGLELTKQIQALDGQLKQLDESIGNYHRNVGNYEGAINKLIPGFLQATSAARSFSNGTMTLQGAVKGGAAAIKTMTAQAMAFIATPLGAAIAALVVLYKALKSGVDDLNEAIEGNVELQQMQSRESAKVSAWRAAERVANEESARAWIKVKGAIGEAWQAYKMFYKYSISLQWGKLWKIATGVPEMRAAFIRVEDLKKQLHELQVGNPDKSQLGNIEKAAKLQAEINQLRAVAIDTENHSEEEREAALRQAIDKNKELYAIKRQELEIQLRIAAAQHAASPDDAQFQQDWARLRAQLNQLDGEEANAQRMLTRSLNKTVDSAKKAAEKRIGAAQTTADATLKIVKDTLNIRQELEDRAQDDNLKNAQDTYSQDLANYEVAVKEKRLTGEAAAEELADISNKYLNELNKAEAADVQRVTDRYAVELSEFENTVKKKNISEEVAAAYRKALADKEAAEIQDIRIGYLERYADAEEKIFTDKSRESVAALDRNMLDLDRTAARESLDAKATITDPIELEKALQDIQQRLYESKIALIDEMLKDGNLSFDEAERLSRQRADMEIANDQRVYDSRKKLDLLNKRRQQQVLSATSSFLQKSAELVGENTAAGKAMAISAATIDTYQSAAAAIRGAFETYPAPINAVMAGIGAGTAIAAGLAQVKQIMAVNANGQTSANAGGSPSIPAIVQPPAVIRQVPVTRSLTSASEEERLNRMASDQRVYLVYSDVEQAGRQVRVQQEEATF